MTDTVSDYDYNSQGGPADGRASDQISVPNIQRRNTTGRSRSASSQGSRGSSSQGDKRASGQESRSASRQGSRRTSSQGSRSTSSQGSRSASPQGPVRSGRSRASMRRRRRRRRLQVMIIVVVLVILVIIAVIGGYSHWKNSRIDALTEEGLTLMQSGDAGEAIDRFDQALKLVGSKLGKRGPAVLEYKAEAEYDLGDYDAAIECLDRLREDDPDNEEYKINTVLCLMETGDYDGALELGVLQGRIYNKMALEQMKDGDYEGAIVSIERGMTVDDGTAAADLAYNLAVAYEYSGDYETALGLFEDYVNRFGSDENVEKEITFLRSRLEEAAGEQPAEQSAEETAGEEAA